MPYGIFIAKMVITRQDKDKIIALLANQVNDFKNKVIAMFLSWWKKKFKKVLKEELRQVEKLNSTVALLQRHVENLRSQNTQLQERCSESKKKIDELEKYGRLCLCITGILNEEKETWDSVLTKVK